MVFIIQWLTRPWTQDLIGTLCHSLWQGAVIAALLYVLLNTMQKTRSQIRYVAGMGALVTLLLCVFSTFAVLQLDHVTPQPIKTHDQSLSTESQEIMPPLPTPEVLGPTYPSISGVIFSTVRISGGVGLSASGARS